MISKGQVAISVNGHKEKLFVPAYHNGYQPDKGATLAFHHPYKEKRGWQFTHARSGLGIGIIAHNIKQSREILKRLTSKFNWNFKDLSECTKEQIEELKAEIIKIRWDYGIYRSR
tara:strand:+ start:154 stop:498 length:345 start_codon:yes stop_codon:yes gene_type:complete